MIQTGWPRRSIKALEFGRGSGDKGEYFFAAALAAVIVGALALTIYFTFIARGPSGPKKEEGWMYHCFNCGAEFHVDQKAMNRLEEQDDTRADCPKCGAKHSAVKMLKCFKCGKFFVRTRLLNRRAKRDVCPYCGTDYLEGMKQSIE